MLVPKELMRLISAREEVGKDSGKKPIGLISANHYRCSETAIVYPRQNTPRKESLKYTESARPIGAARNWLVSTPRPIGAARRNLLEQRATGELCTPRPIGAARRNLLEQRAGTYWSSAQLVSYAHQDLLEQRASRSGTYWSSAQVKTYIQQYLLEQRAVPIGAARRSVRNLLEQRASEFKPIGAARKSFSQVFDFS
jgi:hypothetical protein